MKKKKTLSFITVLVMIFTVILKSKGNQENSGGCAIHIAVAGFVEAYNS